MRRVTFTAMVTILCHVSASIAEEPIDFSRDIRPILSDRCFSCHGPDDKARQAELRLDRRDDALADRDGTSAVVPGSPQKSELVRRILSRDPDERMPPPDSNRVLAEDERQLLIRWIRQGAEYTRHWAFVPPVRPAIPNAGRVELGVNPIDLFVWQRQEREGLVASPPAELYTLIRRVYLDLIGLPPTPEEADEWYARLVQITSGPVETADKVYLNEDEWQKLVDTLLSSKHYGARWARRWLDLARYADTNGYEKDRDRSMWPYRDWVVNTLNADMPFDQFTIEQLAGDMLPDATISQRIATGFHRNTMLNEEGGIDPLEFRFYAMTDRVATTGTTWLGLTLGCAQCHSHKYDPVSHTEYYGFMAFLNNADEPDLEIPNPDAEAQRAGNLAEADKLLKLLPRQWPAPKDWNELEPDELAFRRGFAVGLAFADWLATERKRLVKWQTLRPVEATSNLPLLTVEDDNAVFASGDSTKHDVYSLTFDRGFAGATAIRLEALPDPRLPARGPGMTFYEGRKGDFYLTEFKLTADGQPVRIRHATHSYAKNQFGSNPVSAQLALDGDVQTGWSTNGRNGERHVAVFVLAEPLPTAERLELRMDFGRHFSSSLGRFRLSATTQAGGAEARDLPADVDALLTLTEEQLTDADRTKLRNEFLLLAPELAKPAARIRALQRPPALTTSLVMQERAPENPRLTYRHHRGEFLQTRERVAQLTPETLHEFAQDLPRNRLGLARWVVSPENPLTARVVVNRHWAAFFGKGLVRTLEDFGLQGESPSHPQLIDWLAVEFRDGGEFIKASWSLKQLHRLIVTSAVYRQSSRVTTEHLQRDPENRLLSRSPRFRLEAEIIRDASLHAAGVLSSRMGGPPVRPLQSDGITEAAFGRPKWKTSTGEDRYRRSLYTYQKRTAPFAMFTTFDGPTGEACIARRDVSNTALQALTLLNDVMFIDAARQFGRRLVEANGSDDELVRDSFRRILTRPPLPDELKLLTQFVKAQRRRIATGELDAKAISGSETDDNKEHAVWTLVTRALMSVDEAMTRN